MSPDRISRFFTPTEDKLILQSQNLEVGRAIEEIRRTGTSADYGNLFREYDQLTGNGARGGRLPLDKAQREQIRRLRSGFRDIFGDGVWKVFDAWKEEKAKRG